MYSPEDALRVLAESKLTAVVFDRNGQITDLLPCRDDPQPEDVKKMMDRYPGKAFRYIAQGQYGREDIDRMRADALEGFELAEKGLLGPGADCFGPDGERIQRDRRGSRD